MDTNSLWGLFDELETVLQPPKSTQTTPRPKVFSEDYLYRRLYQPNEKAKRTCQHIDTKEEKKKKINKTPQQFNSQRRNSTTQKTSMKNRNYIKENRQVTNKNKRNPIYNNKSDSKDISIKQQNVQKLPINILKPIPHPIIQSQLLEKNYQQQKIKYNSIVKEKHTVISNYKHPEESSKNTEKTNFTENNPKKNIVPALSVKSDQSLQSHVSSYEDVLQDNNSQVKQLTSYWNNLLSNQQHTDSEDSEHQSGRSISFNLSFKRFPECQQDERHDWCIRNNLVSSRHLSEINVCRNSFSADLNSETKLNSEIKQIIPKSIKNINSEEEFLDHSETLTEEMQTNKNNTFDLFSPDNMDYINILRSNEEMFCGISETLFSEITGINFWDSSQRLDDINASYSRELHSKAFQTTEFENCQTMESNFELGTNKHRLKTVAIQGINLNKVKKALIVLMLYKEYLRMKTLYNKVFSTVFRREIYKKLKNTSPLGSKEEITLGEKEHNDDSEDRDNFEDFILDHRYHNKQSLSTIAIILKSIVNSALDKIVFYGPSIERFIRTAYQFFVSLLIFRLIIMDAFQK